MNNDMMTDVCSINGEDVSINFYTSLDAYRKAQFVASVSDMLVGDNYNYVIKDLAFDFCIIALFTDIDTSDVQNADNGITAMEEFVDTYSLVVDIVVENAEDGLIDELSRAVDLNVEYRTGIHIDPISSSLANLIDNLDRKFSEFDLNSMIDIAKSMSDISGELTAEKMLDAYAKTDIFKKNWETAATDKGSFNVVKGGKEASLSPILSPTV